MQLSRRIAGSTGKPRTHRPEELHQAPPSWAQRAYPKLTHYSRHDKGGHFAAWEQPEVLVSDLRAAFKELL